MPLPLTRTTRGLLDAEGRPALLYGGEIQYYRIRDRRLDPARTLDLWRDRLDRVVDAGMNYVTTYVPWDWHELAPGRFDFEGARDLPRFLELCHERRLIVHFKPGPLINSEWPTGPGSFGALPSWFRERHPEALARRPDGRFYHFHPLFPVADSRQPALLHPAYLDAVRRWFEAVAPIVKRFVHDEPTIAMLQLDNETNHFFGDRFALDHNEAQLAHWRRFLQRRYGTLAALNARWRTRHESFDAIAPPSAPPRRTEENPLVRDWFEAAQDGIAEYLATLRAMWEELGIAEPDVLFTTNDSPHSARPVRHIVLFDGPRKNASGFANLDLYPKMLPRIWPARAGSPIGGGLTEQPFLTTHWAKLFELYNRHALPDGVRAADPAGRACYAVEAQGGLFHFPLGLEATVHPEATRHMALRLLGRSCKALAFYILAEGWNADLSVYRFQAAIDVHGNERPRWDVLREIGTRLARPQAEALFASDEVRARVAVAVDGSPCMLAPSALIEDELHELWGSGHAGVTGWLATAGYDPDVIDLALVPEDGAGEALRREHDAIVFRNPDLLSRTAAERLVAFVRAGGTLINIGRPGRLDDDGRSGREAHRELEQLIGGREQTLRKRWGGLAQGRITVELGGRETAEIGAGRWWTSHRPPEGASILARDARGRAVGWSWAPAEGDDESNDACGTVVHIGAPISDVYGMPGYFAIPEAEFDTRRRLLEQLLAPAGVRPVIETDAPRIEAWARRVPDEIDGGGLLVFVVSGERARKVTLRLTDAARLGLDPERHYRVDELLSEGAIATRTGAALATEGIELELRDWGGACLRVRGE